MKKRIFYLLPHTYRRWLFSILMRKRFNRLQYLRENVSENGCSYQPFDKNKCIFFHVPRTAGRSINKTFFGNLGGAHATAEQYQLTFSKEEFDSYFKFTFVRNPWDRVFSAYNFLIKGGVPEKDEKWAAENIAEFKNFEEFVLGWMKQQNIGKKIHFIPQNNFLRLPFSEKLCVDFIGFFENINEDFQFIKRKLSIDENLTLRHDNASHEEPLDFREHYSTKMREIVADLYEKDINLFGYNFDNSSLPTQLKNRTINSSQKK